MQKPIKLVCFDLNKTLIHENSWLDLNLAMGMTKAEDDYFFDEYDQGRLSYIDWQKKIEAIYLARGKATKETILKVLSNYTYKEGAKEIVQYLKRKGYIVSLLSGSIDVLVEKVAKELGIALYHANNRFIFDTTGHLTKLDCLNDEVSAKTTQLELDCQKLEIVPTQAACVGDGDNDIGLFRLSKHGITFRGSKIEQEAWQVIDNLLDLTTIL